jgi:hypothetical protein
MTFRSRALLNLAQDVPHCMSCGRYNDGTVVAAHCNEQVAGKGMGIKASDSAVAFVCGRCHDEIDNRTGKESREYVQSMWRRAFYKTLDWMWSSGKVRVS